MPSFELCILGHLLVLVMIHEHGTGGEEHQSRSRGVVFVGDRKEEAKVDGGGRGVHG